VEFQAEMDSTALLRLIPDSVGASALGTAFQLQAESRAMSHLHPGIEAVWTETMCAEACRICEGHQQEGPPGPTGT
jgi:hypothetical protein